MPRRLGSALLIACVLLVQPADAGAKDMNGKFGVGFTQTLGGVSGLAARYFPSRRWAFEIDFATSFVRGADSRSASEFLIAAGVLYNLVRHRDANLMVGARVDLGFRSSPTTAQQSVRVGDAVNTEGQSTTPEVGSTPFQVNVEVPLIIEYFFSDSFAVHLTLGAVVIFVPEDGPILAAPGMIGDLEGGDVAFGFGAGGLLGSAGVMFYF